MESFNPTTSTFDGERLVDESMESIWHDVDEHVGGERDREGGNHFGGLKVTKRRERVGDLEAS